MIYTIDVCICQEPKTLYVQGGHRVDIVQANCVVEADEMCVNSMMLSSDEAKGYLVG